MRTDYLRRGSSRVGILVLVAHQFTSKLTQLLLGVRLKLLLVKYRQRDFSLLLLLPGEICLRLLVLCGEIWRSLLVAKEGPFVDAIARSNRVQVSHVLLQDNLGRVVQMAIECLLRCDDLPSQEVVIDADQVLLAGHEDELPVWRNSKVSALFVCDAVLVSYTL